MQLIRTRLRPPTRAAGLIRRRTLDEAAERIAARRLTFVKAPAGYGKSSLLQSWYNFLSADKSVAVGWLSLDRSLDDMRTFAFNLTCSVREVCPNFGGEFLKFLESSSDPSVERVASAFINETISLDRTIIVFIDDFHLLSDRKIHALVEVLLTDAPGNFHLVIASRRSLPFSLARLRMLGNLEEFDAEHLRFNADDVGDFLRLSGGSAPAPAVVERLLASTEGWAAGIQLATISIAQYENIERFLDRFSGENWVISEYLFDDVIQRLPESTVQFLLRTSILDSFNAELCNLLTERGDAREQLKLLIEQSLFIFSLDDEQNWFRYHHLFSELLGRILRERHPEIVQGLHVKASAWYARHNLLDSALAHAVQAEDWTGAARILDAACNDLFYTGRVTSLLRWADQIPPSIRAEFPRLQLEVAWSIILEWRFADALAIITEVENKLAEWRAQGVSSDVVDSIARIVLHRRMMLALFSDDMPTVEKLVLELLHDFPPTDPYLRGTLENCLIYARREMFKLENVDKMDRWAREFFDKSGSRFVLVWHEAILGPTYHLRGDTELAESALMSAMETAEYVDGPDTPLQAMPAMLLAEIKYERNEIDAARELVNRYSDQADKKGFVDHLAAYYVTRARLLFRAGDTEEAERVISEGKAFAAFRGFTRLTHRLDHEAIRMASRIGAVTTLRWFLAEAELPHMAKRLAPGAHSISHDEQFVLSWQLACRQLGRPKEAADILKRWALFTRDRGALRSEVKFLVALAQCLWAMGEEGDATRKMRLALQKAMRPRYVRTFLDGGEFVLEILKRMFANSEEVTGPVTEFGLQLIAAFHSDGVSAPVAEHPPIVTDGNESVHSPPDSLNERERDVLSLVGWGMSNREIARKLGMTEGTVKWYLQQVFSKLDVRRRTVAVRRARELGML
jgi:LuxR family maltose regulon positive regulatory protein